MAVFTYKALADQTSETGTIIADTARAARDQLRARGLIIEHVHESSPQSGRSPRASRRFFRRITSGGVTTILRELSTLLAVGVPLLEALDTIAGQFKGGTRAMVLGLRDDVSQGRTLAAAMRACGSFDDLAVAMTEVGENTGTLDQTLNQIADFRERAQQLKGKIGTALLYPMILSISGVGVTVFLMSYVVPNLLAMLIDSGRQLPTSTIIVKAASDTLLGYWWAVLTGLLLVVLAIRLYLGTHGGRLRWHRLQLHLPGVGSLLRKQATVRLSLIIAALMRAGVEFVDAIRIARRSTKNLVLAEALDNCETAVIAGQDLGPALDEAGAFPPAVVQVFAVGQHSGRLEEMLERLALDYDKQVQTAANRLTAILEPILIILLATVIGFIAFATIMPILEAGNVL